MLWGVESSHLVTCVEHRLARDLVHSIAARAPQIVARCEPHPLHERTVQLRIAAEARKQRSIEHGAPATDHLRYEVNEPEASALFEERYPELRSKTPGEVTLADIELLTQLGSAKLWGFEQFRAGELRHGRGAPIVMIGTRRSERIRE